jgi:hypothetical protein
MADRVIKILVPATEIGFLTLDEAKTMLGMASGDATMDAQLQMWIDQNSATIMRLCNRIFAREKVRETWRDVGNRRVFLSHWPVSEDDIESVEDGGVVLAPGDYELEEGSGKISHFGGWIEDVVITYSGGYVLPADAPLPLKQATAMMVRESKMAGIFDMAASGIRSISHKEKRVQFYDTSKIMSGGGGAGGSPTKQAVSNLLVHYTRWEI